MTMLNIVGVRGSPWVIQQHHLKGGGGGIVSPVLGYHGISVPVRPDNWERPGSYTVCRKNFETPVPVQGISHLLDIQKYLVEDRIPYGHDLLYQLSLKAGSTYPVARLKPMYNVMELYCRGETEVQDPCHILLKDLHESNPLKVSTIPLRYQNHRLPGYLIREHPIAELCLHYDNHLQPLSGVKLLLPCHLSKPLAEVFHPHA